MSQVANATWKALWAMLAGLALSGCIAAVEDSEPTGDEDIWDEGPPAGEEGVSSDSEGLSGAPAFELPFPCGQAWSGQTRSNHSPSYAIDFNRTNDVGDTVVAAASGTVTRVENEGNVSYGRWVEIAHANGYRSRYAHLSTQSVSEGKSVSKGQKIGTVGSTGGSSGPHLHYEARHNGSVIKPVFHGSTAYFWGTKSYTSHNCGGGGGGGGGATGTVNTSGPSLTVRSGPGTGYGAVGSVADGAKVTITCQKNGTSVSGTYGSTKLWDFIGSGYVSDAYVQTGSDGQVAPTCP